MFNNEQLLVDEIANLLETGRDRLSKSIKNGNMRVLREVNLGYGIADLVIALYGNEQKPRHVFLNSTQIRLFNIINNNPGITFGALKDATRASDRLITNCLKILVGERLIDVTDIGIMPTNEYVPTLRNSIAIEAKLKNWRRALKQAYRYKWFSDCSYVCLPATNIKPALSNIECFKQMKVGLISISEHDGLSLIYNPKPVEPICAEMKLLLNEILLNELYSS